MDSLVGGVTFELRPEVKGRVDIRGNESDSRRGNSTCKGPEVGTSLVCPTPKETAVVGWN